MRKLILILAALSVALVVAVGCGNEDEAASGAAELAPAGAVLYAEATLKPEGDQKEAIDAILAKFPGGGEAGDKLKELIEKGLRDSDAPVSFEDDIEPWLGDSAAFFASGMGASGDFKSAAGLIATEDEDKAQDALEKTAEGKITRKSYRDVEYLMDEAEETNAAMVHEGFVVLGSEAGVKAVIDVSEGDSKLSEDERYKSAIEDAADDRLGLF
jgi:ABC-type glycerol-3-phosphate transport system substrate-binding protein